jgi:hypothetical protein
MAYGTTLAFAVLVCVSVVAGLVKLTSLRRRSPPTDADRRIETELARVLIACNLFLQRRWDERDSESYRFIQEFRNQRVHGILDVDKLGRPPTFSELRRILSTELKIVDGAVRQSRTQRAVPVVLTLLRSLHSLSPQSPSVSRIARPPGAVLLSLVQLLSARSPLRRSAEQAIADMRAEYCEALASKRWQYARWVRVRGYISVWAAIAMRIGFWAFAEKLWSMFKGQ